MELTAGKIYTFEVEDKSGNSGTKDSPPVMIPTKRRLEFIQYDGNTAIFNMDGRAVGYNTATMKNVKEATDGGRRRRKTRARKHKRVSRKTRRLTKK